MTDLSKALAQPEQEPVAWIVESKHGNWAPYLEWSEPSYLETQVVTPLYIAPPKREWVGLTDAQVEEIAKYHGIDGPYETSRIDFYRAIEITLKEKNT